MAKVSRRGGFSDRNNIKCENTIIQLKDFDKRTRIQFQNMLSEIYQEVYSNDVYYGNTEIQDFFRYVVGTVYAEKVDYGHCLHDDKVWAMINSTIQNDDYDDVLTLVEAIIQYWDEYWREIRGINYYNSFTKKYINVSMFEVVNAFFEREYIGYRFIDGLIMPISDEVEIEELNQALSLEYDSVYTHLSKANRFLADRDAPDYENSIKESISAVEALCEILTGAKGKEATLGKMLKKLEKKGVVIHAGLQSAFNTLYGYTSDANGIRHAGDIGGPSATFEEAKYMLVSCCAFINYLKGVTAD